MATQKAPRLALDRDARSFRYYRNAVERHWDPADVDLSADVEALASADQRIIEGLYVALAKFGAGEQAVTEDLSPLAQVVEPVEDQLFVTTQLYEEAKHTDFFDRYWREVVHAAEEEMGIPHQSPTDPQWFDEGYTELFDRNQAAMERLPTEDTPENRARAYCHYHLVIEGVLAQTGYYGLSRVYGDTDSAEAPHLPGLVEGLRLIRGDEGRHVGFGMAKLKELVEEEGVDPGLITEVTDELLVFVQRTVQPDDDVDEEEMILDEDELTNYAAEKHVQRIEQITNVDQSIPAVEELTRIEG